MSRISRILPGAGVTVVLALATTIAVAAPAQAHDGHDDRWWEDDDAQVWGGAGGGWNGSSWRQGGGTTSGATNGSTWTPQDTRVVQVRDLALDRGAISPNGDGEGDEAFVSFRLRSSSAPVRVEVLDQAGVVIRTLGEQRTTRATATFGWDGTTDADVAVADGAYRIRLSKLTTTTPAPSDTSALLLDVLVDTAAPSVTAKRPTLVQLQALARRAGALRDARRRWEQRRRGNGNKHGHARHRGTGMSAREREWVRLWESRQLRLPMTFSTVEDGNVTVTAKVGTRSSTMTTWRVAGRSTVNVVMPTYANNARAELTFAARDDAGNAHRHTVVVTLPAMPAPVVVRRQTDDHKRQGSTTPVTNVPTDTAGPLPDWLDPIMLRATYGAGVPQSWAKSKALSNLLLRESSYRPTAQNPTSTAYGLFQFLNTTWATVGCRKTSDAYQQSVCGLRYVQRRYGTPEKAWAFWQAHHWY